MKTFLLVILYLIGCACISISYAVYGDEYYTKYSNKKFEKEMNAIWEGHNNLRVAMATITLAISLVSILVIVNLTLSPTKVFIDAALQLASIGFTKLEIKNY